MNFDSLKEALVNEEQELQKKFEEQKTANAVKVAELEKTLNLQTQNAYNQKLAELKGKRMMLAEIEKISQKI